MLALLDGPTLETFPLRRCGWAREGRWRCGFSLNRIWEWSSRRMRDAMAWSRKTRPDDAL